MINYRKAKKLKRWVNFTESRLSWALLLIGLIATLSGALFFQYVKGLEPCYLCIIQRIGVIIGIAGTTIGLLNPKWFYTKLTGLMVVLSGLGLSLYSSIKLVYMQANPPMFSTCGMSAEQLMDSYGILKTIPILFQGSASCTQSAGSFFFLSFEQWTLSVFVVFTLIILFFVGLYLFDFFKKIGKHY